MPHPTKVQIAYPWKRWYAENSSLLGQQPMTWAMLVSLLYVWGGLVVNLARGG